MPKTRVLVVEDSLTVRQRLVEILVADPEIELVGEAEDGKRAIEICRECRPDVITMDMMLPVMSGLASRHRIHHGALPHPHPGGVGFDEPWRVVQDLRIAGRRRRRRAG